MLYFAVLNDTERVEMLKVTALLSLVIAGAALTAGCENRIGGPELDNKTGTYANDMEARKLNYLNNPTPSDATIP